MQDSLDGVPRPAAGTRWNRFVRAGGRTRRLRGTWCASALLLALALLLLGQTVAASPARASVKDTPPSVRYNPNVYVVDWAPADWGWGKPGYNFSTITQFIIDMNKSSYSNLLTEYGSPGTSANAVSDMTPLGGACVNSSKTGGHGTQGDPVSTSTLESLITGCITGAAGTTRAGRWTDPTKANNIYLLYTPENLYATSSIPAANGTLLKNFCGYHWYYNYATGSQLHTVVYGVIGSPAGLGAGNCSMNSSFEQSAVRITSHELFEAITSPAGGGNSYGPDGGTAAEIADYCDNTKGTDGGGSWQPATNVSLNGHTYELSGLWSKQAKACKTSRAQPQVSFTLKGPLGNSCGPGCNGWYTGNVSLTWDMRPKNLLLPPTTNDCANKTFTTDSANGDGTEFTCTFAYPWGSFAVDDYVLRDATPPSVSMARRRAGFTIRANDTLSMLAGAPKCNDSLEGGLAVTQSPRYNNTWTTSVEFMRGTHVVTCQIQDHAGNTGKATSTIVLGHP
jgi:hypothetical protein